jgi:hypothetical protein
MKSDIARTFEKPYRTHGARLFNLIGRQLRRWGWGKRLSINDILDSACRSTKLSDWGDERFHEPLQVLVKSLEEEAQLNPLGRVFMRLNFRHFAANRLRVRHFLKLHPEALAEPVPRPLFLVGLPRTGTTLLYNLLSQDAARRSLLMWEALQPVPEVDVASGKRDRRLAKARRLVTIVDRWGAPQLKTVHPLHADGPEECTCLLFNTFVSPAFLLFGNIPAYSEWLNGRGRELLTWVYEEYRTYLQVLQYQGRRAPWVLKSPAHFFGLEALLKVFPDACVVRTHRDMNQVIPSTCSLFAIMQGLYSDDVDCRQLGPRVARSIAMYLDSQADREGEAKRVINIQYRSLLSDPLAVARKIYSHFGLAVDEEMERRMRQWLAENPANKHGVHQYDLEQFGLTRQDIEGMFGLYQESFATPRSEELENVP